MGTPFPHQGDFGNCEINIFIKKGCRIYLDYYRDYNGFARTTVFTFSHDAVDETSLKETLIT
jgi:hypothetical protein